MYHQDSAEMNYDYPLPHYPPQSAEYYASGFNFDLHSYVNLASEPHLPPAPNDLFMGYPQAYPPIPIPSVSPGQGQMYPPSLSEYPSNGAYSWTSSPPPPPPPAPIPPISAPSVPHGPPPDDDQRVQHELLELLGEYHAPVDNFYAQPQSQMYDLQSACLPSTAPSPYTLSGHDYSASSPQSSLVKPSFDEDPLDEDEDDFGLDLEDLELPNGVTETDLATLKIPDLNRKLRDLGLSRDDQNLVKKIRRQHKNRRYAHTCRQKKVDKKNTMKVQKHVLESEINELKSDVEKLRRERDEYKKNYEIMQKRKWK